MKMNHSSSCFVFGVVFLFMIPVVSSSLIYNQGDSTEKVFSNNISLVFYDEYRSIKSFYWNDYYKETHPDILQIRDNSFSGSSIDSSGVMDSAWPMKCHDLHHTGRSPYSTAGNPLTEKWRFECGWVADNPVLDKDGTIYVGGAYGAVPYYFFAVYPNGTLKWMHDMGGLMLDSSPILGDDGTIYVGCWDNYLHAINLDGTLKWKFLADDNIFSSPALGKDGTIYFGADYNMWAVNPNGTAKWQYSTGYSIASDPAIGDDGTIYIGSGDTYVYALYPNGNLQWRFKTGGIVKGSPSIADDGTIYIGSYDGYLYALYPNGTLRWRSEIKVGTGTETNPSVAPDGTIYVGDDKLYAFNPDGTLKWSFNPGPDRFIQMSCPTIAADGTIFIGLIIGTVDDHKGGEILAVYPDGTERWRQQIANFEVQSTPTIAEDGTVYIGSSSEDELTGYAYGYLYAFGTGESNHPPAPPTITGETQGTVGKSYNYTAQTTDIIDDVYYYVNWGDGYESGWRGPYSSGGAMTLSHTFEGEGTFTVRAKVHGDNGVIGDWGSLTVTMPCSYERPVFQFWERLLERFPNAFPLLRQILN